MHQRTHDGCLMDHKHSPRTGRKEVTCISFAFHRTLLNARVFTYEALDKLMDSWKMYGWLENG